MSRRTHKILTKFLLKHLKTPRCGVEVGVFRGEGAEYLLEHIPRLKLLLVDPWKEWPEGSSFWNHRRIGKLKQIEWDEIYNEVRKKFIADDSRYKNRVIIDRRMSTEAAAKIRKESKTKLFDFAYLDGNHTFDALQEDIDVWLPLVRKGGLICGDDFGGRCHEIAPAVNSYFKGEGILLPGERIWGVVKR